MKLHFNRDIEQNIYSTILVFDKYGNDASVSEGDEQKLINDFGPLLIDVGGLYSGFYKLDGDGKIVESDETDADAQKISFSKSKEIKEVNPAIQLELYVNASSFPETEIKDYTKISNLNIIAECKVRLFEKIVKSKIDEALNTIRAKATNFVDESPINFFV